MRHLFFYIIFFLTIVCASKEVYADFYKYVDDKGTVNMTNDVNSVPDKYKPSMKVIKEIQREERSPAKEEPAGTLVKVPDNGVVKETKAEIVDSPSIFEGKYFKGGMALIVYALGAIILYSLSMRFLNKRMIIIVVFFLMSGALATYFLKIQTNEAYNKFKGMKEKVVNMQKKLEKNAEKKAKAMKDISETIEEY